MALCRTCDTVIPCHCHIPPPVQTRPGVYLAAGWRQLRDGGAPVVTDETEPRTYCTYCAREIENRGEPNMGGPSRDGWVHIPGGYTVCYPQAGADSPRATPVWQGVAGRPECSVCREKEADRG